MSIERSGPQGYDYQYLVTAYLSLRKIEENNIEIYIEKEGGEDAEILFRNAGERIKYEVQVKGTKKDIGMEELVSWLHHFPNRESEENLLSRLIDNKNSLGIFFTRGRCRDEIKNFVSKNTLSSHITSPLDKRNIKLYVYELGCLFNGSKGTTNKLEKKRKEYCQRQIEMFEENIEVLKEVSKRVLIFELQEEDLLKDHIFSLLNKKYLVPQNQTSSVLINLIELIKKGRNEKVEIFNEFYNVIQEYSANQIFNPELNIIRPETPMLKENLEKNNVLLMTGISFCGKTHLAKQIAGEFQSEGYNCLEEIDVSKAIRFLSENTVEERLCILEDPFGHFNLEQNIVELWTKLEDFSYKIKPHRKLIITSKKDLLTLYNETKEISECNLGDYEWVDLTLKENGIASTLWEKYALTKNLNPELISKVKRIIIDEKANDLLQPGQIKNLVLKIDQKKRNVTKDEMFKLATIDSKKISQYYRQQDEIFKKVVTVLGLGANTVFSINEKEVAHILSSRQDFPGIDFLEDDGDGDLAESQSSNDFPQYEEEYCLNDDITNVLDNLISRNYIVMRREEIWFSHPTFLEASKYFYFNLTKRSELKWFLKVIKKTLSNLNPSVALAAVKQLRVLHDEYHLNSEFQKEIIEISLKAMNSIFPSVRDEALIFLIAISENLSLSNQEILFHQLKTEPVSERNLMWKDGKPWILNENAKRNSDEIRKKLTDLYLTDKEVFESYKNNLLNSKNEEVPLEVKWKLLHGYISYKLSKKDSKTLLYKIMFVNESFIRSKSAYFLLRDFAEDQEIVDLVLNDPHPYVRYQGIKGIFQGWSSYEDSSKKILLSKLLKAFKNSGLSVTAHYFMINFNDLHGSKNIDLANMNGNEKKSIWELWAILFPEYLNNLPPIMIKESALYLTIQEADKQVSEMQIKLVIESWVDWINRNLVKRTLTDYGLGVAEVLLTSKTISIGDRESFVFQLLNSRDSNFICNSLGSYIDHWNILNEKEKLFVLQTVSSNREDSRWLKAISLTRRTVPIEIQELLLGGMNFQRNSAEEIINKTNESLVKDCLMVHFGCSNLAVVGGQHNTFWESFRLLVLKKPYHLAFRLVVKEWINIMTSDYDSNSNKQKSLEDWKILCSSRDKEVRDIAFHYLLEWSVKKVGVVSSKLWEILFAEIKEKSTEYINEILDSINAIEARNENLAVVFGEDVFWDRIMVNIKPDNEIYDLIINIYENKKTGKENEEILNRSLLKIFTQELPTLYTTNNFVEKIYKYYSFEMVEEVKEFMNLSLNKIKEKEKNQYKKYENYCNLENWLTVTVF